MIISASRRTDIPAYYAEWFMNRLKEGFALVPNPFNSGQISRVALSPSVVDCIVFWTKNPRPMLPNLREIENMGYPFYFQFSLLPYGRDIEPNLPPQKERVETLRLLSAAIGPARVVWRYDPVIIDALHTVDWHLAQFQEMCSALKGLVNRCIISFVDTYRHGRFDEPAEADMRAVAKGFAAIAAPHGLPLYTCAEAIDLQAYGIGHASCIDKAMIEQTVGMALAVPRDKNQRPHCQCVESVDMGVYNTCANGCRYCYATKSAARAAERAESHDPLAPMLTGWPKGHEAITDREMVLRRTAQIGLSYRK